MAFRDGTKLSCLLMTKMMSLMSAIRLREGEAFGVIVEPRRSREVGNAGGWAF